MTTLEDLRNMVVSLRVQLVMLDDRVEELENIAARKRPFIAPTIDKSGGVKGPTGVVVANWNTDPTKAFFKIDVASGTPVVTELDSQPTVWGESEEYHEKAKTFGDVVVSRWG